VCDNQRHVEDAQRNETATKQFKNSFETVLLQFHFNCADSFNRAQSSWASVSDEAAAVNQVAVSMPRRRLLDDGGDLELVALPYWKQMQLAENWRDASDPHR